MAGEWITALSKLPEMQFHEDVGPKLYVSASAKHTAIFLIQFWKMSNINHTNNAMLTLPTISQANLHDKLSSLH